MRSPTACADALRIDLLALTCDHILAQYTGWGASLAWGASLTSLGRHGHAHHTFSDSHRCCALRLCVSVGQKCCALSSRAPRLGLPATLHAWIPSGDCPVVIRAECRCERLGVAAARLRVRSLRGQPLSHDLHHARQGGALSGWPESNRLYEARPHAQPLSIIP